uniref:Uncharacterized protein n=1 Tax=Nelumbo nucifera TaxID=4432 RepID=A0A822XI28_NELNU|nr:TPA_asm: hypothetical protein HUJ06_021493 [Nelumbo nucifera]
MAYVPLLKGLSKTLIYEIEPLEGCNGICSPAKRIFGRLLISIKCNSATTNPTEFHDWGGYGNWE